MAERRCGSCTLCCTLVPVDEGYRLPDGSWVPTFKKPAGVRCPKVRFQKGCSIYKDRPLGCREWQCMWLQDPEGTAGMRRPDRAGYVVDSTPDVIWNGGQEWVAMQVWVDPKRPDAHEDPALRALIDYAQAPAIIRYNEAGGFALVPPSISEDGEWKRVYPDKVIDRDRDEYHQWMARTLMKMGVVDVGG